MENFDNPECIRRQQVEIFFNKFASVVPEARKNGRLGNKQPATDLRECGGNTVRFNVPAVPNTTFMLVNCQVPNGNNDQTSSTQLQASYTDVRLWEELSNVIEKNCGLKDISNKPRFRLKHPGVPDGSDDSDGELHANRRPGDGSHCILTSITMRLVYAPSE